jgi:biotin carboxylase
MASDNALAIVVDPFSAGNKYPEVMRGLGIANVFAVLSHTDVHEALWKSFHPEDFTRVYEWNDEVLNSKEWDELVTKTISQQSVVVVPGCETGVVLADRLAADLQQRGNNPNTSKYRRNKLFMGQRLREKDVDLRAIDQTACKNASEAVAWCTERNLSDCFVKPLDSGGSDKVRRCRVRYQELSFAINDILTHRNVTGTKNEYALIQECIDGTEYVVDHVSLDGNHFTTAVFRYSKRTGPDGSIIYDTMRLVEPDSPQVPHLVGYTKSVLDALEVKNGPSHAELMLDAKGPVLIEVGARPHGGIGGPLITRLCCGANQLFHTANLFLNSDDSLLPKAYRPYRFGVELFLAAPSARLLTVDFPLEQFRRLETCHEALFFHHRGESIPATTDLLTSPGRIVFVSSDLLALHRDLQSAKQMASDFFVVAN